MKPKQEQSIHRLFVLSIVLKGVHALVEIAGGIALSLLSTDAILRMLYRVDRHDAIARFFTPNEHRYYAIYLLSHGAINLVLAAGLLREKRWAYPATFITLSLFIAYQLYRYTWVHDPGLLALSFLDLIVIALSIHEYRLLRHHRPTH